MRGARDAVTNPTAAVGELQIRGRPLLEPHVGTPGRRRTAGPETDARPIARALRASVCRARSETRADVTIELSAGVGAQDVARRRDEVRGARRERELPSVARSLHEVGRSHLCGLSDRRLDRRRGRLGHRTSRPVMLQSCPHGEVAIVEGRTGPETGPEARKQRHGDHPAALSSPARRSDRRPPSRARRGRGVGAIAHDSSPARRQASAGPVIVHTSTSRGAA